MTLTKFLISFILSLFLPFTLISLTYADGPGDLDTSFDGDGKVITPIGSGSDGSWDVSWDVAIQADGKIVAIGDAGISTSIFALVRYNPDGSLDPDFGTGGQVTTMIGSGSQPFAVAIQADGKILVGGYSVSSPGNTDFALARYQPDGAPDPDFGSGGQVVTPFGNNWDAIHAVVIQPDGKIVAAGSSHDGSYYDFALARYQPDGTLDSTFGTEGKIITSVGIRSDYGYDIALQPDGKIVMVGSTELSSGSNFALVRYNSYGILDTTFGVGGIVTTSQGFDNRGHTVALQADSKIILGGFISKPSTTDLALLRYQPDGTLDSTFDGDGKITTPFGSGSDGIYDVTIQPDNKIVAVGYHEANLALLRYNSDGSLDLTFGSGGIVTTSGITYGTAVALQTDRKIVVSGSNYANEDADFAVARYLGDPGQPDLDLTKAVAPIGPIQPGQIITYTLTFSNVGNALATGILLTDIIPAAYLSEISVISSVSITPTGSASYTWQVADLAPQQEGIISITGRISPALSSAVTITNTATISSSAETLTDNNEATVSLSTVVPELSFSDPAYPISEAAGQAILTITLSLPPLATVTADYVTTDGTAQVGSDYTLQSGTLTFITGTTSITFSLPISDDTLDEANETLYLSLSNPVGASLATPNLVTLTIEDNDQAGITVSPLTSITTTEKGSTANFTVLLNLPPTAPVTLTLNSSDLSEAIVAPTTLVFSPSTWYLAQTVTITGQDDFIDDGNIPYTINFYPAASADLTYYGLEVTARHLINLNDDIARLVVPTTLLTMTEGTTTTYKVRLNSQPTAPVVVNLASDGQSSISPTILSFTMSTWDQPQVVTLLAIDEGITEGKHSSTVTHSSSGTDPNYHQLKPMPLTVALVDVVEVHKVHLPLIVKMNP